MATETEEPSLFQDEQEEGGGPVKPFLEHLEDLRWTLIKCVSAITVAVVVCLLASKFIIAALALPLRKAAEIQLGTNQNVTVRAGASDFNIKPGTNAAWLAFVGTNQFSRVLVEPDTNSAVGFKIVKEAVPKGEIPILVSLKNYAPFSGFAIMIKTALYGGIGLSSP